MALFQIENGVLTLYDGEETHVTVPDGVTTIGKGVFRGCTQLVSITLPDTLTTIDPCAFEDCRSLARITLPAGVTEVFGMAFKGCESLSDVTLPDTLHTLGIWVFAGCPHLSVHITSLAWWCRKGWGVSRPHDLYLNGALLTQLVIPDEVTCITAYAFEDCTSLTDITLHAGVTVIEKGAFRKCPHLTHITLPAEAPTISPNAFEYSPRLAVHIKSLTAWCRRGWGIDHPHDLYLDGVPVTELVIPDDVTAIADGAFRCCWSLTGISLPDTLTVGENTFRECKSLASVTIRGAHASHTLTRETPEDAYQAMLPLLSEAGKATLAYLRSGPLRSR